MRFLFWNIKNGPVGGMLRDLANEHRMDAVILAECSDRIGILEALNSDADNLFHLVDTKRSRVAVYTRFPPHFVEYLSHAHDKYLAILRLGLPLRREFLLGAIHFPSKKELTAGDQQSMASRISTQLRLVENQVGHFRTVLVGDLNMNPFDAGMVSAEGFHAVMTRQIAKRSARVVRLETFPFFYNPMWGQLGDITDVPPGTFYRAGSAFIEYFWQTFDQVLIRPSLLECFDAGTLKVLTKWKSGSFLKNTGIPDRARISDHLPLLFELNL